MPYDTATPLKINDEEVYVRFSGPGVKDFDAQTTEKDKVAWARQVLARLNAPPVKVVTLVVNQPIDLSGSVASLSPREIYERDLNIVLRDKQATDAGISVDGTAASEHLATAQASWTAWQAGK